MPSFMLDYYDYPLYIYILYIYIALAVNRYLILDVQKYPEVSNAPSNQ